MNSPRLALLAAAALAAPVAVCAAQYQATFIETSKAWGTAVADYNGDGHDDIFITGHDRKDRIWYWTPGGYVAGAQTLPNVDRHDCTPGDFNRDGRMDFYCVLGARKGKGTGSNEMWTHNATGDGFTNAGAPSLIDKWGRGRIPVTLDFNHDGWPDLYVTNLPQPRSDGRPNENSVFVNQRNGKAARVNTIATGMLGSEHVFAGDINGDGWDDLLLTSECAGVVEDKVTCHAGDRGRVFLNNQAGNFTDAPSPLGGLWRFATLADLNADARQDIVLITLDNRLQVWLSPVAGGSYGAPILDVPLAAPGQYVAVGDFNRDGLRDLYVVLADDLCETSQVDAADDVVFEGTAPGAWQTVQLTQGFNGCGHWADVVDGDKVLLLNGTGGSPGPNYLIEMTPAAAAGKAGTPKAAPAAAQAPAAP